MCCDSDRRLRKNNNCSLNHHYRSYDDDILSVLIGARRAPSVCTHARTYYINKQNAYCFAICHADWPQYTHFSHVDGSDFFFTIIVVTGTRDFISGKQNRLCVRRRSERPMKEKIMFDETTQAVTNTERNSIIQMALVRYSNQEI